MGGRIPQDGSSLNQTKLFNRSWEGRKAGQRSTMGQVTRTSANGGSGGGEYSDLAFAETPQGLHPTAHRWHGYNGRTRGGGFF